MTHMTDKCNEPTRVCPIDSDFMQEHGIMKTQIAEIYKKSGGLTKWMPILITVGVLCFTMGREITLSQLNNINLKFTDVGLRFDRMETTLSKLNDKLDQNIKDIGLRIEYNSNRLTRLEERTKP